MALLVNSDILRLVARLVLGYLDEQNLPDAYNSFCETSHHLTKEYLAYKEGTKSIDTSIGLVNIISEYFLLKEQLNDFIRSSPKTSLIIQLIDTSSIQLRFELIFKKLKENLLKFDDKIETTRKRKNEEIGEYFDVSQTNTSTPESSNQPLLKRRRISINTPFITLSAGNSNAKQSNADKSILNRKELNYVSTPDTSTKEEDESEEEKKIDGTKIDPEILTETLLRKRDFVENLADIINKTRSAKELESPNEASTSQNALTQTDVQDILSKTENDFEDILKEVIDKFLEPSESAEINDSQEIEVQSNALEVPYTQRLRPRSVKKVQVSSVKKKKKVEIISNEIYTGPIPSCATNFTSQPIIPSPPLETQPIFLSLVPIMPSTNLYPFQQPTTTTTTLHQLQPSTTTLQFIPENSPPQPQIEETENIENPPTISIDLDKENEKLPKTPKAQTVQNSFLESKCKSTPRRKLTHVRILDFTQTPRLASIKEFSTPSANGIKLDTPGSAPASINLTKTKKVFKAKENEVPEMVDDSSNSTSISHTPKVAKDRRRRKIEIDGKKKEESPGKNPPMTIEEWKKMREEQKSLSVDALVRMSVSNGTQKPNLNNNNKKKRKTPKKKVLVKNGTGKKSSDEKQQAQGNTRASRSGGGGAKFKVTSPRKAALLRKTPKKKKTKPASVVPKSPLIATSSTITKTSPGIVSVMSILTPNIDAIKQQKEVSSDMNRSDSVQEVAKLLTNLPETILAKTKSGNFEESVKIDQQNILLETPLKMETSMSPLPNTPRFAIPLITTSTHETPIPKAVTTTITTTSIAVPSIVKHCDILTPSFPITPGFKETPLKSDSPTSAGGYSSRRTDYSSCSSYYKPDESEEINKNIELLIKKSKNSQSESDGGVAITEEAIKIRVGSAKKVECPAALDRVLSFTEDNKEIPVPHYTMNEGLLSESIVTTASDSDSDSSSSSCTTCSTCSSTTDENTTNDLINQSSIPEDPVDSDWHCEKAEVAESNNSLVDEKTGELRFPLRNLMTPRKEVQEIKTIINEVEIVKEVKREKNKSDKEAIKARTLRIIRRESTTNPPRIKKSNAKAFKLPAEQPKAFPQTRREQILNQNFSARSRPTPLKLIPSSSSRRKNLTPRKTIVIDELPKIPSPQKKKTKNLRGSKGKSESSKSPERISLENISDNAVDDHPSLNLSTSLNEKSADEGKVKADVEGSNTFQKAMIEQGFDKKDAVELEKKFEEKEKLNLSVEKEEGEMSDSEDEEEEECIFALSDELDKSIFNFKESKEKIKKSYDPLTKRVPSKLNIDGERTVKIDFSETMEIFSLHPKVNENNNNKKKTKGKSTESSILGNAMSIDKILSMIHGSQ